MELDLTNPKDILRIKGARQNKLLTGPKWVSIGITKRCNINCSYCLTAPFWDIIRKRGKRGTTDINFSDFKKIIEGCRMLGAEQITLSGGEPFLHPEISKFIDYVYYAGLNLVINTNGTFESKLIANLKKVSVVNFNLSSTTPAGYQKLQGNRNLFNKVLNNIQSAHKLKNKTHRNPFINIVFVMNKYNYKDFNKILGFTKSIGGDGVVFEIMRSNNNTKELALTPNHIESLKNEIRKIIHRGEHKTIRTNIKELCQFLLEAEFKGNFEKIDYNGMYTRDFYFNRRIKKGFNCYYGWFFLQIAITGDVFSCCTRLSAPIGNIYEKRLKEIWNSAEASKVRSDMKENIDINKKKWKECVYCSNIGFDYELTRLTKVNSPLGAER